MKFSVSLIVLLVIFIINLVQANDPSMLRSIHIPNPKEQGQQKGVLDLVQGEGVGQTEVPAQVEETVAE